MASGPRRRRRRRRRRRLDLHLRLERQRMLDRPDGPIFWAVIDEAALRRP
ncbi:Scr1 family TA system antitoxin-like transcriptional regulator, partial [Nonomuraea fuscirosea]